MLRFSSGQKRALGQNYSPQLMQCWRIAAYIKIYLAVFLLTFESEVKKASASSLILFFGGGKRLTKLLSPFPISKPQKRLSNL